MSVEWTPADYIEMTKALFIGVSSLCLPVATVYTMVAAARAKRAEKASLVNTAMIANARTEIETVRIDVNSKMAAFLEEARKAAHAKGMLDEKRNVADAVSAARTP